MLFALAAATIAGERMADYDDGPMDPLNFAFVKDRYDFELARKEQLTAALGLPVGILGLLGSLLDANTLNNDARSALLYWARIWLFALLSFTTLAGFIYVVQHARFHV